MSSPSRGRRTSSGRPRRSRLLPAGAPAVHFGSLTSWQPPGDEVVNQRIAELRAAGSALISYDPNARPTLQGDAASARAKVARSAPLAHVIKASSDDIDYLYDGQEVGSVAEGWLGEGAALVVITSGSAGATAWVSGQAPVKRPAFPTPVVDTVGAGDAFMSGLLDALGRRGLATPEAVGSLADPSVLARDPRRGGGGGRDHLQPGRRQPADPGRGRRVPVCACIRRVRPVPGDRC